MRKIKFAAVFVLLASFTANAAPVIDPVVEVMKMRGLYQRITDNDFLLFGDKIAKPEACYQAALSNYVEDKWAGLAKSFGCANDEALCNKDPKEMEKLTAVFKQTGKDINNKQDRKEAFAAENVWYLSASMYKLLRKMHYALDPNDETNSFSAKRESAADIEKLAQPITPQEKQQIVDELNQYISGCDGMKPVAWMMPGNAIPTDERLTGVSLKIGMMLVLTGTFVTQQLPEADKGYVGCIYVWNAAERSRNLCKDKSCADAVPADDRAALTARLEELKAHQCSINYALQMIQPADEAQPVKP